VFNCTQEAIVVTDLKGTILTANPAFTHVTEYSIDELVGCNMNILHSGRQNRAFYQQMWANLRANGTWQGAIWNRRKSGDIYPEWLTISAVTDPSGGHTQYVGISLDISRAQHVETQMEHMAHHDALTDLPNRLLLQSRFQHTLERAKRDETKCAILYMDLDGFKSVNDTLGHAAGDELLKAAAKRMRGRIREIDTLARLGGDEFVVVMESLDDVQGAINVAQQIIDELSCPFFLIDDRTIKIGCSVGIALFPMHGDTCETLMNHADAALYQVKRTGKGRWALFTD
jgi:diguanylate cyclase (GGDEF)-like protein/PAS domain S-box-containing protein